MKCMNELDGIYRTIKHLKKFLQNAVICIEMLEKQFAELEKKIKSECSKGVKNVL